ncbi:MAG: 4'-phosphopantetheinyl transferase superfamily protein [Bacteroidales bacterium]|nr:4'-phosphopantetheinyl transferase superfamily protein [Bacteroidales bacterium]
MALYLTKELDNEAVIYVWEITETEQELMRMCSIPNDELEELSMIGSEARRKEKLAVRALLGEIFDEKVYLGHHDNGRPFLHNSAQEISISHTRRFVAIITHRDESLGIDIESLDRNFDKVQTHVLSEDEIDDLSEREESRNLQLAIIWSAKEAIYKRMSLSNVDYSDQIEIERFSPRDEGTLDAVFTHKDGSELEFELEYMVFDGHVMVWLVG